ncbi:hypothetical protein BT96DRAFT_855837, partial [Gymnopus androsaceus JB14]
MQQMSLQKIILIATWLEAVLYGMFVITFALTMYLSYGNSSMIRRPDRQSGVLAIISVAMFILGTFHILLNCLRMIQGYTEDPAGPLAFYDTINLWSSVTKNVVYATQEVLGSVAATYRCYVLWDRDWRFLLLPTVLILGSLVSGYGACALLAKPGIGSSIFNAKLASWVRIFYALAVIQNVITTSLMAYRIWTSYKRTSACKHNSRGLLRVIRILIESAALQLIPELALLVFYSANMNAHYIALEAITPLVGITFNAITIRLRLKDFSPETITTPESHPVQTIGSMPLRRG